MNPEFIDVHAHLNFAAFDADREAVVKRALDAGVWMINVGTQQDTSRKAIELAEKYERGVYAIIGLHPIHTGKSYHDAQELGPAFASATAGKEGFVSRGEVFDSTIYRTMAAHPKVVGVGECGLDYYHDTNTPARHRQAQALAGGRMGANDTNKIQEENFRKQIELAIEVGKPLMLHVRSGSGRSAYRDALAILRSFPKVKGNFHFFAGSWEEAKEILDAGFNLSFTGVITFARDYDEVIKNAPLDRILSETDCPYVTPAPHRGKCNEPLYVEEVVKTIASVRKEPFEQVQAQLVRNAVNFFHLSLHS